jgi:NAD(P)-dependent dehydrogenase (short-subunit alcohol dehydrogenase family)
MAEAVALIIGGSYGIGEGISKRLAKDGNIVVIASRDEAMAAPVLESIKSEGGKASWIHCDATSEEEVNKTVAQASRQLFPISFVLMFFMHLNFAALPCLTAKVIESFQRIDILIQNAGIFPEVR